MFYQLPPVGNPVSLAAAKAPPPAFFSGEHSRFYQSGTAALAAAICAARAAKAKLKPEVEPEVIMPAYGCPDLVSAALFAGVRPVLVDLEAGRPWLDLDQLETAVTPRTIAIIGVNLFGLAERWPQLRVVASRHDLVLIEDSAQYFPAADEAQDWQGDLVVLSFGRGKPLSLLGGGAVLVKQPALSGCLPDTQVRTLSTHQRLSFMLKTRLYNAMISPYLYWLPSMLPFLHLGETRYHALEQIKAMDDKRRQLLESNRYIYQHDSAASERCRQISAMLDTLDTVNNLPEICKIKANRRLLRYPLLVDAACRDSLYRRLQSAGLGPSVMYPASLPKIAGLDQIIGDGRLFPHAESFARQLITLPTHAYVSAGDIKKMKAVLSSTCQ